MDTEEVHAPNEYVVKKICMKLRQSMRMMRRPCKEFTVNKLKANLSIEIDEKQSTKHKAYKEHKNILSNKLGA